jgi:hypothetical protein
MGILFRIPFTKTYIAAGKAKERRPKLEMPSLRSRSFRKLLKAGAMVGGFAGAGSVYRSRRLP